MILELPITAIPNQRFSIELNQQRVEIELRQIGYALMASLWVDEVAVYQNSVCGYHARLGQYASNLFSGALFFHDTLGTTDPYYKDLGTRYKLYYVSEDEDLYKKVVSL